jgi:hypothetical protein
MNFTSDRSVPFEITDINHGFQEAKGILKLARDGIAMEFEVQDSLVGIFKSGVKNLEISYADLESVEYKKGWFRAKIVLKGVSMRVFEDVPGTEHATCTLKVKREYREAAQNLVSKARLYLSEYRLSQLEGGHE